ncbi:hypothetical protein ACNKHV_00170 [Shigella flexneri]
MQICLPTNFWQTAAFWNMGAKSQLNGRNFYIILWLMHVLQGIRQKESYNLFLENTAQQEDCMKQKQAEKSGPNGQNLH